METLFWIAALIGTLFFSLKVLASILGAVSDDIDMVDLDAEGFDQATDKAFKIFSIHSLTGFFMMFGWVGLACHIQYKFPSSLSIAVALAAGLLMMTITTYLFKLAALFISPGTKFHIEELLEKRATVYQKIPAMGIGKIQVTVNGYQREIHAISESRQEISSFTQVAIAKVIDHQTVAVNPVINH